MIKYMSPMLTETSDIQPDFNSDKTTCESCSKELKPTKLGTTPYKAKNCGTVRPNWANY